MAAHGLLEWQRYAGVAKSNAGARLQSLRQDEQKLFVQAQRLLERFGRQAAAPRERELWLAGTAGLKLMGDAESLKLADELKALIGQYRFKTPDGSLTRSQVGELRRSTKPAERLEARRLQGALASDARPIVLKLLARRNEVARSAGFGDYYDALLRLRGVDPGRLDQITGALRRTTRTPMQHLSRRLITRVRRRLLPWDFEHALDVMYPIADSEFPPDRAVAVARAIFARFGFDLSDVDVKKRDFAFGGQAISVRVPSDVRVVIRPQPGPRFLATLLHEFGHAVAARGTQERSPLLKGYEWIPGLSAPGFAEGQAELFGRLLDIPDQLRGELNISAPTAKRLAARRRAATVIQVRRLLGLIELERRAYADPSADLDALSLQIERQSLLTYLPRGVAPVWSASPFHASYPVYRQSYLIAAMMSVQVRAALMRRFAERWIGRRSGAFIRRRLVNSGVRWTTDEQLVRATGQPLHWGDLVNYLTE